MTKKNSTFSQESVSGQETETQKNQTDASENTNPSENQPIPREDTPGERPSGDESADKDKPLDEGDVKEPEGNVPPDNPNEPTEILNESEEERSDRHEASTELGVGAVTDPETQGTSLLAEDAKTKIVPGAASGPDNAGVVRNDAGKPAYAPPGSYMAAQSGVQEDASGHVSSVHTDNSSHSGTRV